MPRQKSEKTTAEINAEIERLHAELRAAQARENSTRGELLHKYLNGPHGDSIRTVLKPIVSDDDRYLFGL